MSRRSHSYHGTHLDISIVEFRLVKNLVAGKVGDLDCCQDWKIFKEKGKIKKFLLSFQLCLQRFACYH